MFSRRTPSKVEKERFGRLIRDLRKSRGLTQEKLAECMNCSLRWISSVERGKSNLNWRDMVCLMMILGVSPEKVAEEVELDVPVLTDRK